MRYGITGPSKGLTENQERYVADTTLFILGGDDVTEFWSGCAHKVDSIGVAAALRAYVPFIGLAVPRIQLDGHLVRVLDCNIDSLCKQVSIQHDSQYEVEYAKPGRNRTDGYMNRNALLVSKIDRLLAFPETPKMELRSGTWATIRRARDAGVEIWFYPLDGTNPWIEMPDQESMPL
jgi:hypothetical protein